MANFGQRVSGLYLHHTPETNKSLQEIMPACALQTLFLEVWNEGVGVGLPGMGSGLLGAAALGLGSVSQQRERRQVECAFLISQFGGHDVTVGHSKPFNRARLSSVDHTPKAGQEVPT